MKRVLVTGSGIDDAQLTAVADKVIPGNITTFRTTVLTGLTSSPLQHGAAVARQLAFVIKSPSFPALPDVRERLCAARFLP